ncbi:MAG: hypothetical protein KatS3mg131_1418 [Candidatus Tectimicrobiota bacterium]|nr:MAG: hypothetical protein KatS3mg131_1418 [Candidatus Tectomicrobia bacterium]
MPHYLVATDFSSHADEALTTALALAQRLGARLTLLHVIARPPLGEASWLSYLAEVEAEAREALERRLARVREAGLEGEAVVVHGIPWQEIVAQAQARKADLVVVGTHGRSGLLHALLGSVAEKVVRHAPCPVLVVRTAAAA